MEVLPLDDPTGDDEVRYMAHLVELADTIKKEAEKHFNERVEYSIKMHIEDERSVCWSTGYPDVVVTGTVSLFDRSAKDRSDAIALFQTLSATTMSQWKEDRGYNLIMSTSWLSVVYGPSIT
ncbi:hypothetical protein A2572_04855 [Candidatus Collierbacteria bacterium RIFOXYD1_FULL_40_9]|uniref:Uncharacterized protein n=1 Tax=Candidatus Collierbacteria bacterium RIFOXYD1_FULL_40_9 TaxID=1817731 RepID=A0A1F5FVF4_9BACT|nr:MAG: hypothetical protein A2572_04855 [Candidatus Collierbacteria bacterium RIFOXYD1_FULL_40_9]